MESQPQNPEFRKNSENFHPCIAQTLRFFLKYFQCPISLWNDQ